MGGCRKDKSPHNMENTRGSGRRGVPMGCEAGSGGDCIYSVRITLGGGKSRLRYVFLYNFLLFKNCSSLSDVTRRILRLRSGYIEKSFGTAPKQR